MDDGRVEWRQQKDLEHVARLVDGYEMVQPSAVANQNSTSGSMMDHPFLCEISDLLSEGFAGEQKTLEWKNVVEVRKEGVMYPSKLNRVAEIMTSHPRVVTLSPCMSLTATYIVRNIKVVAQLDTAD